MNFSTHGLSLDACSVAATHADEENVLGVGVEEEVGLATGARRYKVSPFVLETTHVGSTRFRRWTCGQRAV